MDELTVADVRSLTRVAAVDTSRKRLKNHLHRLELAAEAETQRLLEAEQADDEN